MSDQAQRVFVSIAAYRDRDCPNTIQDLFAKAAQPERIFVGLCWQSVSPDDDDCQPVPVRPDQCRVLAVPAGDAHGVCWARHQVQNLWQGEDFVLQIDSHMRFVEDWDQKMIDMLALCPSEKPVLSTYPAPFTPPDHIESHVVSVIYANGFDRDGILKQNSIGHMQGSLGNAPLPSAFIAGGFIFGDSRWITEVPYDPALYFLGEEITLAVRLYSHGWDIFTPYDVLLYHDYGNHSGRKRHWDDHLDWSRLNERSLQRVRHLLGMDENGCSDALRDIARYGLGTVRSLAAYEAFADIDFRRRLVHGKTTADLDSLAPPEQKRRRHAELFEAIWRQNSWGAAETRSGGGSTLAATEQVRRQLVELCAFLGIRKLVDAGCGDLNWMKEISERFDIYFGLDVVDDLIGELVQHHGQRRGHFFALRDITLDDLPCADAVLCRDVLTHFPADEVQAALTRIKASGSAYLIATTHALGQNRAITMGDWQPIDLCAAPFGLPHPYLCLSEAEGTAKSLGVWRVDQIPDYLAP